MDLFLFAGSAAAMRYVMSTTKSKAPISLALLNQQNAMTSARIIEYYSSNQNFQALSSAEGLLTAQRDAEDAEKLHQGIVLAQQRGVIDPSFQPEPYVTIDVLGKTPDQVAETILKHVGDTHAGAIIVLVGLSGTGKGTTVSILRSKLEQNNLQTVTWSNGNIFRSVTLLAATWCEQNNCSDDIQKGLSAENIASFMKMLSFEKNSKGMYDTRIQGLGLDLYVSEVENTLLKSPLVSKNIPTVAAVTQGEVILFAAAAVETLKQSGMTVLLEGRQETVNYVRTPHRFILMLSDESLIGKRRAAQRLMGAAVLKATREDEVVPTLDATLEEMVNEINMK